MGDPSGGGGGGGIGGKSGGDPSGGGGGIDPSAGMGGADPSMGMGGGLGGGDMAGLGGDGGMSGVSGQFGGGGGMDPTGGYRATQAFQGGQLNPQQVGDQPMPSSPVQQQNQPAQPQPSMQQPNIDIGKAFGEGPGSHPTLTGQPGGEQFASLTSPKNPLPAVDPDPEQTNIDPSQRPEWKGPVSQFGNTDATKSEPWAPLPNTNVQGTRVAGANMPVPPPGSTGPEPVEPISTTDYTKPPDTKITEPPGPDKAPVIDKTAQALKPPVVSPETAGHTILPPGTDTSGTTPPATEAGAGAGQGPFGQGGGNPFEQLIGGLMHMIFGQGMGPLEQMIGRALGINTHGLFHSLYGGGFNAPFSPGHGYFPPGSTGGRPGSPQPSAQPARPQAPPPQSPPGTPGSQGNPPSATAPRTPGRELKSLPGYPYTSTDRSRPPPWYPGANGTQPGTRPGQAGTTPGSLQSNQIQVPRGAQQPSRRQTQPTVDRSSFQTQLAQNPQLVQKLAWMVNGEVGKNAPVHAKIVQLETVFNRAFQRGGNLNSALGVHSHANPGGYYAADTYKRSAAPSASELEQFKTQVLGPVMNGSNLSDVGFGPMTGNASGSVASHQFARGQQGYKLQGGDVYFREGPFRKPFPVMQDVAGP